MKTTIYYFSGTGNSLAVAKKIRNKLDNCTLIPIGKTYNDTNIIIENEKIGLIFPIYFADVHPIVIDFLNKTNLDKVKYIFAIPTAGGAAGNAFESINKVLKEKNKKLNFADMIALPGNYILAWYYKLANRTSSGKKSAFKKSNIKINEIIPFIKENKNKEYKKSLMDKMMNHKKEKRTDWDKDFHSNDNCNSCGTCEKVCPVNNIKLTDGKPTWNHNCQLCMACIQLCPVKSINYKYQTQKKKRYHHPEITLKEMMIQKN